MERSAAADLHLPPERLRRLFAPIAAEPREVALFAYLDPEWSLLGARCIRSTQVDTIELSVRTVAIDVLAAGATLAVMAHNHPSGDARFSQADVALTRRVARALGALGVSLFDHWLVTRGAWTSLRANGGI